MSDYLTVSQAAARLGLKERTVQKRCAAGKLTAQLVSTPDGDRWQIDRTNFDANEPPERTRTDANKLTCPNSKAPEPDANEHPNANTRELLAEKDARIADLRSQIDAWRLQAEAANRTAAETSAALRKALDQMPKALPDASTPLAEKQSREDAAQAPIIPPGDVAPVAQTQSAQRGKKPRKLTAWQRIGARILGIR